MKKPRKSKANGQNQDQQQHDETQPGTAGEANPPAEGAGDQPAGEAPADAPDAANANDQTESSTSLPAVTGQNPSTEMTAAPGDSLVIVPRHIAREDDRRAKRRALFNSVCNKAANMTGRMAMTSMLKIAGASLAVGAGASALGVAAAGIALAGVGSAVYTYGSESYKEYRARKAQGEDVTFFNVLRQTNETRTRRALTSLACGVAFGALGAYLMQSDMVQWAVEKASPVIHGWISSAAGFFGLGTPSADDVASAVPATDAAPVHVAPAAPAADAPAVEAPAPHVAAAAPHAAPAPVHAAPADVAPADVSAEVEVHVETTGASEVNVDVNVNINADIDATAVAEAASVSSADVAADPLAAGLAQAHLGSLHGASAQSLKDAAHSILRMDSIDAADRIAMARALAQEAAERGNAQAVTFLTDLPKVEAAFGLEPSAVPDVATVAAAAPAPDAVVAAAPAPVDIAAAAPVELPEVTLAPGADTAATVVTDGVDITPVAAPAPVTVSELPPLAPRFASEAAVCSVTMAGDMPADINCAVSKDVMDPTDYISFVDAANPSVRVTTTLDGGSVAVATTDMLQEVTLSDGASRLQVAVRAVLGLRR